MTDAKHPLALSTALTARTNALALGLEHGAADLLELVTPATADLLHWWFGQDMVDARGALNFHPGQKQAILNAIVAHEVLGATSLQDLYEKAAPDALLAGTRLAEFDIEGLLGVGGFGLVYKAFDRSLQRSVAIKEYLRGALVGRGQGLSVALRSPHEAPAFQRGLQGFLNEARLLAFLAEQDA